MDYFNDQSPFVVRSKRIDKEPSNGQVCLHRRGVSNSCNWLHVKDARITEEDDSEGLSIPFESIPNLDLQTFL